MGIIDAYAAFNYLSNSYDPVPPNNIGDDLVLEKVTNTPMQINCEEMFNRSPENNTTDLLIA